MVVLGVWLVKNGEVIYGILFWFMYGEGFNDIFEGNYIFYYNNYFVKIVYFEVDICFMMKGNNFYFICLGKFVEELLIVFLNLVFKLKEGDILKIIYLGSDKIVLYKYSLVVLVL